MSATPPLTPVISCGAFFAPAAPAHPLDEMQPQPSSAARTAFSIPQHNAPLPVPPSSAPHRPPSELHPNPGPPSQPRTVPSPSQTPTLTYGALLGAPTPTEPPQRPPQRRIRSAPSGNAAAPRGAEGAAGEQPSASAYRKASFVSFPHLFLSLTPITLAAQIRLSVTRY